MTAFTARTGHEPELPDAATEAERARAAQAREAWASLLRIRRLVQPEHPDLPAPWERARPLQAVGLALEAGGVPFARLDAEGAPARSGVQLTEAAAPGTVRAVWAARRGDRPTDGGEAHLTRCAELLAAAGWEALLYRAPRHRFLTVEPARPQ